MKRRSVILLRLWLLISLVAPSISTPKLAPAFADARSFKSYDEAVHYVRKHYSGESIDTRRSSWITSAEYFPAEGRGYLILGMRGNPYIFAGVPVRVWEGFKAAPSLGKYYNAHIKGRYRLELAH